MLERMWSQGNSPSLLVGLQTCTATSDINKAISQKMENQSTSGPSDTQRKHSHTTGHLLNNVHSSIICNSHNLETTSTEEQIKIMWYIYTMEYYSAKKNNDIKKFADI